MVTIKRYVNKTVVNIPMQSHFIKGLVFILYTHPFPCSGKHTHLQESCLFLSPHSVYIIKSVNLTWRLLTVSWHSTVQLCYNSVNQLLPFTWREGCTQFFFSILAICCKHSCACVLTLLLTSALYTVSRGHTREVGHGGVRLIQTSAWRTFQAPSIPSHRALWALPVCCPWPVPRGHCSFSCCYARVLFTIEILTFCHTYWVYFLPVHQSMSLPSAINLKKKTKKTLMQSSNHGGL